MFLVIQSVKINKKFRQIFDIHLMVSHAMLPLLKASRLFCLNFSFKHGQRVHSLLSPEQFEWHNNPN